MSKILFFSCNKNRGPYPVYPLSMSLVAGALQKAGHTFFQLDMMRLGQKEILARAKA